MIIPDEPAVFMYSLGKECAQIGGRVEGTHVWPLILLPPPVTVFITNITVWFQLLLCDLFITNCKALSKHFGVGGVRRKKKSQGLIIFKMKAKTAAEV